MRVYHRTAHAAAILGDGFRDTTGTYMTGQEWTGVWLSNWPLNIGQGAQGEDLLAVEIPDELFEHYEWVEQGKGYREALIPAELVNRCPVETVTEEEEHALAVRRYGDNPGDKEGESPGPQGE